ncbi:MAG: hypothetical protein AAFO69_15235 [Bacteroidota bacterium]
MGTLITKILGKKNHNKLKLKFEKAEDTWYVMQGHRILYIGEKQMCEMYMSHFSVL